LIGLLFPFLRGVVPTLKKVEVKEIDVSAMKDGELKIVRWKGRNVLIVKRDPNSIMKHPSQLKSLADPFSRSSLQPEFANGHGRSDRDNYLVVYSYCTLLSCELKRLQIETENGGVFAGFFCPCDGSRYDTSGRVIAGSAAKYNLSIPNYEHVTESRIRLTGV
jgi:ubiquinol-cytochrome c reductase iron-sulfur subunit